MINRRLIFFKNISIYIKDVYSLHIISVKILFIIQWQFMCFAEFELYANLPFGVLWGSESAAVYLCGQSGWCVYTRY